MAIEMNHPRDLANQCGLKWVQTGKGKNGMIPLNETTHIEVSDGEAGTRMFLHRRIKSKLHSSGTILHGPFAVERTIINRFKKKHSGSNDSV